MVEHRDLLIEIGTEELPPKALLKLANAFRDEVLEDLAFHDLDFPEKEVKIFATPRRLAMIIPKLVGESPATRVQNLGPAVKAAFDAQGKPTSAALGFAKKNDVDVSELKTLETDKGPRLYFEGEKPGRATAELVPAIVQKALDKLPTPRRMRWGNGTAEFVRPVHWLVLLYGDAVIEAELLGVRANRYTRGHRFHYPAPIHLDQPRDYAEALEKRGQVIPDFEKRRAQVRELALTAAAGENAQVKFDEALLDEVTALCEWPQALVGSFDSSFLELPEEAIIAVLQDQQRYFPLRAADGRLLPRFIVIANITSRDPAAVRHGNERVIRPRLADAVFFWNQDRRAPLHTRLEALKEVVFQKQLGSLHDKTQRLSTLAIWIARHIGADATLVKRAAELSRCDLLTLMVGEFPELQGIMGRYYAAHDGEGVEISTAIDEMYHPRFAGDVLPKTPIGLALALADKLDTLVSLFGIGQIPTGDKDPFGLRRAALGVVRILLGNKINLGTLELVEAAIDVIPQSAKSDWLPIVEFILDRARSHFLEQGYTAKAIEAVLLPLGAATWLHTLPEIVAEASNFIATADGNILAEANKRITNILKKSGYEVPFGFKPEHFKIKPNVELFREKAEIEFWNALQKIGPKSLALKQEHKFAEALRVLSKLGEPTKLFFDNVMVNVENSAIRDNRIVLLQHARAYMNQVADLSLMAS